VSHLTWPARLLIAFAVAALPSAQDPRGWRLSSQDAGPITLPAMVDIESLDLDYDDRATVVGHIIDLDGDGEADFIVRSAPGLCGATGNCPFAVVDGRSGRRLGQVGGTTVVIVNQRVNGYPILQTWWTMSADAGEHSTYQFDGGAYRRERMEPLSGDRRQRLLDDWRELPPLPGRGQARGATPNEAPPSDRRRWRAAPAGTPPASPPSGSAPLRHRS
jgi:hypothetical protein